MSTELEGWKRAALNAFYRAIEKQLLRPENQRKTEWEDAEPLEAMNEVWYHAAKLLKAVKALEAYRDGGTNTLVEGEELRRAVLEFSADVGACAMILADVTQALEHTEDDVELEEHENEKKVGWGGGYP